MTHFEYGRVNLHFCDLLSLKNMRSFLPGETRLLTSNNLSVVLRLYAALHIADFPSVLLPTTDCTEISCYCYVTTNSNRHLTNVVSQLNGPFSLQRMNSPSYAMLKSRSSAIRVDSRSCSRTSSSTGRSASSVSCTTARTDATLATSVRISTIFVLLLRRKKNCDRVTTGPYSWPQPNIPLANKRSLI